MTALHTGFAIDENIQRKEKTCAPITRGIAYKEKGKKFLFPPLSQGQATEGYGSVRPTDSEVHGTLPALATFKGKPLIG